MAKASKEEQRKAPILRFKGFTDDWEQRKLNDMSKVYDGIHETPQYTTKGIPFVSVENIKKLTTKKFVSKEFYEKKFKVKPEKNDIFITRIGDIGTSNVVSKSPLAYYVSLALVKINQDQNSYFFKYLFDSEYVQKEFWKRTLHIAFPKKINKNEIGKINIHITNTAEEDKIAQLFNKLESLLALYERKVKLLSQVKKYFLDNLFAEKEYPNLRFKGFTDAWEQRKLLSNIENIIDYRGKTPKKLGLSWDGERNYPALSAINVENGKINLNKTEHFGDACLYSKWMKKTLKLGQVILTTEAPVGNVAQIKQMKHYILSQRVIAFETDKNLLDDFLYFLLQRYNSTLLRYSTGGTAKGISQKSLRQVKVNLTSNINEQKQISQLLSAVKNLITLYEDKQQHLIEIKNTLLNTMFI